MAIFDFVKSAGTMISEGLEKAADAAQAQAPGEAAATSATEAPKAVPAKLTESAVEAKIRSSKIKHRDLALKLLGEHGVKVYAVVENADDKADLILLVGNMDGVEKVEDAIKVRPPGSDKDVEAPAPRFYRVKSGDTLSDIAQRELGDADRYMDIFNANRNILSNPDQIDVGQTLRIPGKK